METRTFGRYEIRDELGRGGMATVYRAYDPSFEREVAVKILPHAFLHDPSFRARFIREAKTIATLEHSAIVPVHDFGEQEGQPYLIMRLMTGGSLAERLLRGPLPLAEAARILGMIAPALDEAHAHGVIHRDLKPGNILFDQSGAPYLSDFGIAKIMQATVMITGSYAVVGTPAYMSPEQARGDKDIDGRSDIYALGTILFEMLSGHVPYQAETPTGQLVKHLTEPVPNILEVRGDLPIDCQTVIGKAMAKDKTERYRSAVEMAQALQAVVRGEANHAYHATQQAVQPVSTIQPSQAARPIPRPARQQPAPGGPIVSKASLAQARPAPAPRGLSPWIWAGMGIGLVCLLVAGVLTAVVFWNNIFPTPIIPTAGSVADKTHPTRTHLPTRSPSPTAVTDNLGQASTAAAETILVMMTQSAQATQLATQQTPSGIEATVPTPTPLPTLTPTSTLTQTPTATATPPSTQLIAYVTGSAGDWRILLANPSDGTSWLLPNQPRNSGVPAWAPDGNRLSFRSNFTGSWQVYTINVDGTGMQQLTTEGINYEASWSPDGRRLAFVSERTGDKEIYTMMADGSGQTRLTFNAGWDDDPSWSPDGEWLLFESKRGGRIDVYKMRSDGSEVIRLTSGGDMNSTPAWSPDGQYIAFERTVGSLCHLWVMRTDTSEEWQVTFDGTYNQRPAWSPDSSELAFTTDLGGDQAIWIVSIFGGEPRRLSGGDCYDPAWGR